MPPASKAATPVAVDEDLMEGRYAQVGRAVVARNMQAAGI